MPVNVYLVFGEDEYRVSSFAKETVETLLPEAERALGLETVDGVCANQEEAVKAVNDCIEATATVAFMGSSKVVWLRDASFLSGSGNVGGADRVKEAVGELVEIIRRGLPESTTLVISAPKVDKRTAIYKVCAEKGQARECAMPQRSKEAERQAADTLDEILSEKNLKMDHAARTAFMGKVGMDTRQIRNEVEKLAVYTGNANAITAADVDAVTSASKEAIVWDLTDGFGNRNVSKCLRVVRMLSYQKESAVGMLIGLERHTRMLMIFRESLDAGWLTARGSRTPLKLSWAAVPNEVETAFTEMFHKDPRKEHSYRQSILAEQAMKFSLAELTLCQKLIGEAYRSLLSSSVPDTTMLDLLVVRMLCGVKRSAPRNS